MDPSQTYIYTFLGLAEKKKNLMVMSMCRLLGEVSLLDGARVPRFPSYIYIYMRDSSPDLIYYLAKEKHRHGASGDEEDTPQFSHEASVG